MAIYYFFLFTACNVTYYGEVGRSYEIELRSSRVIKPPFTCILSFVAAGDIYGDLVQVVVRDLQLGSFRSHHVYGCPKGELIINEPRRPHRAGSWCGGSEKHNVYYSETSTVAVTIKLPKPDNDIDVDKPFSVRFLYKFLLAAEAVVRFGPWNRSKFLGSAGTASVCDRIFDSCDRRRCRIQSPNYPGMYPRNITCQYSIRQDTVPHGRHALVSVVQSQVGNVHIKHTDSECDKVLYLRLDTDCDVVGDTLSIYEVQNTKRRLLLRFCGGGPVPRVTASGSEILLVFQTSPYDNMHFDASKNSYSGFELDVGVTFVPKNSFFYANPDCEFIITSYEASRGHFENVAHALPRGAKCIYKFHGRPNEVIWLFFTRLKSAYALPLSRDAPHCRTKIILAEGEHGEGPVLENTCGHMGVRICHREQLGPGRNRTRPCGAQESYLTQSPYAALKIQYLLPSAVANLQFRLHYEFVYAGSRVEALTSPEPCSKHITSDRNKKGLITSPGNNLLYGKFGESSIKCRYTLKGKPNEAIRLTFISFYAHNSSCYAGEAPLQACGAPGPLKGRGARLEVAEYPWPGVELPLACLCHGYNLPAAILSFSSNLAINFSVVGMNVFDDFSHFTFELQYEFVDVAECEEDRIVKGEAGLLSLALNPPKGPCSGHPWLLKPSQNKFLLISVPGKAMQGGIQSAAHGGLLKQRKGLTLATCGGPELHVYQPGNPRPLSAICLEPGGAETVHVFSDGFTQPWSLDYLDEDARSLVVVLATNPTYMSTPSWISGYDTISVRWVEATPLWLATRCATECPAVHACISASLFCDGSWHCPTGADEAVVTCLMALSPWLWLFFGITFGTLSVLIGWWGWNVWKRHKEQLASSEMCSAEVLSPGHHESQPEPSDSDYPECIDVDFETTV